MGEIKRGTKMRKQKIKYKIARCGYKIGKRTM
jgi:predicted RNA-binding Zn-ribbon protein involved in translation (DUF1610 family)